MSNTEEGLGTLLLFLGRLLRCIETKWHVSCSVRTCSTAAPTWNEHLLPIRGGMDEMEPTSPRHNHLAATSGRPPITSMQ